MHLACQVTVGALVGAAAGIAWACVLRGRFAEGWFEALAHCRVGCMLQLVSRHGGSSKGSASTATATQSWVREKQP